MKSVAIVGTGLIGASFGLALRKAGFDGTILGVSSEPRIADALAAGAIDRGSAAGRSRAQADLVFLSQTIGRILDTLRHLDPLVRPGALVTDAGSTKCEIVDAGAAEHPPRASSWAAIPWPAKRSAGRRRPMPDLFRGRTWVLTPDEPAELDDAGRAEFVAGCERIGAHPVVLDPAEHDRVVSLTSHLPQLASTALAATVAESVRPEDLRRGRLGAGGHDPAGAELLRLVAGYPGDQHRAHRARAGRYIQKLEHMRENLRTRQLQEEFERGAA